MLLRCGSGWPPGMRVDVGVRQRRAVALVARSSRFTVPTIGLTGDEFAARPGVEVGRAREPGLDGVVDVPRDLAAAVVTLDVAPAAVGGDRLQLRHVGGGRLDRQRRGSARAWSCRSRSRSWKVVATALRIVRRGVGRIAVVLAAGDQDRRRCCGRSRLAAVSAVIAATAAARASSSAWAIGRSL